jgi:hypothetical protein
MPDRRRWDLNSKPLFFKESLLAEGMPFGYRGRIGRTKMVSFGEIRALSLSTEARAGTVQLALNGTVSPAGSKQVDQLSPHHLFSSGEEIELCRVINLL